jgi:hypothetical protein
MLAISAIDKVENDMATMTTKYIQIAPAVPPFESGASMPIMERTHPLPKSREYPKIERNLKFLWDNSHDQLCLARNYRRAL